MNKSVAVKYEIYCSQISISHCHSSNNDHNKSSNKDMAEMARRKTVMGTAMIKTKVLMIMFTVKVAVDMTVATTTMAENNTQQK